MTHTPIDTAALKALEKAGTPRPWRREPGTDIIWSDATGKGVNTLGANGDFIIALRNAAPELIKAVKERDELQTKLGHAINAEETLRAIEKIYAANIVNLRALLAEAGEALKPFAEFSEIAEAFVETRVSAANDVSAIMPPTKHFRLAYFRRAVSTLASIQTALRDASPTMGKPE